MTNGFPETDTPDEKLLCGKLSVRGVPVRLILEPVDTPATGGLMQYALLIYGRPVAPTGPISEGIATVLAEPNVTGWARLHADESATTLREDGGERLLTDGPFIDSKEYLAGLVMIDADSLDAAIAVAHALQDGRGTSGGAIEIRPVVEGRFGDA